MFLGVAIKAPSILVGRLLLVEEAVYHLCNLKSNLFLLSLETMALASLHKVYSSEWVLWCCHSVKCIQRCPND